MEVGNIHWRKTDFAWLLFQPERGIFSLCQRKKSNARRMHYMKHYTIDDLKAIKTEYARKTKELREMEAA